MAPSSMDPRSIGLLTALKSAFADTDLPLGAPRAMSSCDEHNSRGQSPTPRLTKPSQPVPTRLPGALMHGSCMANASTTVATPYAPYRRARSSRAVLGRNATGPIVTGPAAAGHALPEVEPAMILASNHGIAKIVSANQSGWEGGVRRNVPWPSTQSRSDAGGSRVVDASFCLAGHEVPEVGRPSFRGAAALAASPRAVANPVELRSLGHQSPTNR